MRKTCGGKWWHYLLVLAIVCALAQGWRLFESQDVIAAGPTTTPTLVVVRYSSTPSPRRAGNGSVEMPEPDVQLDHVTLSVDEYQDLLEVSDGP